MIMRQKSNSNRKLKWFLPNQLTNYKGFTLVEIVIVISIIGVLVAVAVPSFIGYTEKARKVVCDKKCSQLEAMYESYLILENIEHSEAVFEQYVKDYGEDVCPGCGDIRYWDGKVQCLVHSKVGDSEGDGDDETVPFL